MASQGIPVKRWNLFARELETILATRNIDLDHLDEHSSVSRETVLRLSQSLRSAESFPILDVDEMESVVQSLRLSEEEVIRLRAAILATCIERMLMERINQDSALLTAEKVFSDILKAMVMRVEAVESPRSFRIGDGDPSEDNGLDMMMESVLEYIDSANMALYLSRNAASYRERLERVRQARASFEDALTELEEVDENVRVLRVWRYWYDKAQKGRAATTERLEDLGAL